MARTFVQQSQIRDSEEKLDTVAVADLASTTDLAGDLNALRSQVKRIIGDAAWTSDVTQDLADIEAAMVVDGADADFQGMVTIASGAEITAGGLDIVDGGLDVQAGGATIAGDELLLEAADLTIKDAAGGAVKFSVAGASGNTDIEGTLDVAGQVDLAAAGSATNVRGTLDVAEAAQFDSTLNASGDLSVGDGATSMFSVAAATGNTDIEGTLDVAGESTLASAIVSDLSDGHIVLAGASGALQENAGLQYSVDGAGAFALDVNGSMDVSGQVDLAAAGVATNVRGSLNVDQAAQFDSSLNASGDLSVGPEAGPAVFSIESSDGSMSASSGKFTVDVDGAMDAANGAFAVASDGALAIATDKFTVSAAGVVAAAGDLSVAADFSVTAADGSMSAAGGDFTVSAAGAVYAASDLEVGAKFEVTAADGSMSAANGALIVGADGSITIADGAAMMFEAAADGDVTMAGNLQINGNLIKSSTGATAMTLDGTNVTVAGNLTVNGQTTTIDTDNLSVKDTLIHLNAGGTSAKARGIVMHGSAADGFSDLGFGAAASDGDFVFAREIDDSEVDGANDDVFAAAKLAAAWMSSLKLGGEQGTLKGALSYDSGDLLVKLESESDLRLVGAGDLKLQAHNEEWNLSAASAGVDSLTDWNDQFDGASIIEAILSLASGGSYAQKVLAAAVAEVPAGDEISFSSVGSLRDFATMSDADKEKSIDVYLNGVRLVQGASEDYELFSASSLKMKSGINVLPEDRIFIRINNPA